MRLLKYRLNNIEVKGTLTKALEEDDEEIELNLEVKIVKIDVNTRKELVGEDDISMSTKRQPGSRGNFIQREVLALPPWKSSILFNGKLDLLSHKDPYKRKDY